MDLPFAPDPWVVLATARTSAGDALILRRQGACYEIRCNGAELMSNRAHHSEEELARRACARLKSPAPRVLVGGLGLGFTLRAALDALPKSARVTVAEALPEVVAWNKGPLGPLAHRPLEDPRVVVAVGDVAALMQPDKPFDALVLDVDNGPDALSLAANDGLYTEAGLAAMKRALAPGGLLALWSAAPSPAFERRLERAGFSWCVELVPARGLPVDPVHTLYLADAPPREAR